MYEQESQPDAGPKRCAKCGSDDLLFVETERGGYGAGNIIPLNGLTILSSVKVNRFICVACGFLRRMDHIPGRPRIATSRIRSELPTRKSKRASQEAHGQILRWLPSCTALGGFCIVIGESIDMISKEYALAYLVWSAIVGSALLLAVVLVERRHRRRVIFQTLLFTIGLTLTGFMDAISRQLNLIEPGIGVGVMATLAVVGIGAGEWLLGDRRRVQAGREEEVAHETVL